MTLLFIALFIGTFLMSLAASWRVKRVFHRYSQIPASTGHTGREVALAILRQSGIHDVQVIEQEGMLGDHYDPMHKRLVLSSEVYHSNSTAALGIAAHECGHAIQHQKAYAPLQWRMAAVGATTFASQIVMWLPLVGMFTGLIAPYTGAMIMAAAWGVIMVFNLITLPVEFDASNRAKALLPQMGFISRGEESNAVSAVLNAAAWTYVAAFITSLLYFLWHLLPLLLGGRRED